MAWTTPEILPLTLWPLRTRMPFRYGIATMTAMPQVFLTATTGPSPNAPRGMAAEILPPKWFTKDPTRAPEPEIDEMRAVIETAARQSPRGQTLFDAWLDLYQTMTEIPLPFPAPPLLRHLGTSMVERAWIDLWCRSHSTPFHVALRQNRFGIDLGRIHPELAGSSPADYLPTHPLPSTIARHTVGLSDPLADTEICNADRIADGLPQSLESALRTYGLRHLKIKLQGQPQPDIARLHALANLLDRLCPADYQFTLDGNEQFQDVDAFRSFWTDLQADPVLRPWLARLLFVEQPLHRQHALAPAVGDALRAWPDRPPLIIDESDGTLDALPTALDLGYIGTSHKNCKGIFKSIANRCLLEHRRRRQPGLPWLMSGEDLCTTGPHSVLADLAVTAALGIESVERNGHHYVAGLSQYPPHYQKAAVEAHPGLYAPTPAGWPTLQITQGALPLATVNTAPFGCALPPHPPT